MDLFEYQSQQKMKKESPLAARLRPTTLDEFVGQEHIVGKDTLLYRAIKADKLSSIILYGPPGTGKTTLAMVIANSPLQTLYFSWWERPVLLQIGDFNLFEHHGHAMSLMQVINDALMAIFFFSVGLEIKREVLVGELSSLRKALLPVIAAVGGIVLPITIYRLLSSVSAILQGSAIPMATDFAFSF